LHRTMQTLGEGAIPHYIEVTLLYQKVVMGRTMLMSIFQQAYTNQANGDGTDVAVKKVLQAALSDLKAYKKTADKLGLQKLFPQSTANLTAMLPFCKTARSALTSSKVDEFFLDTRNVIAWKRHMTTACCQGATYDLSAFTITNSALTTINLTSYMKGCGCEAGKDDAFESCTQDLDGFKEENGTVIQGSTGSLMTTEDPPRCLHKEFSKNRNITLTLGDCNGNEQLFVKDWIDDNFFKLCDPWEVKVQNNVTEYTACTHIGDGSVSYLGFFHVDYTPRWVTRLVSYDTAATKGNDTLKSQVTRTKSEDKYQEARTGMTLLTGVSTVCTWCAQCLMWCGLLRLGNHCHHAWNPERFPYAGV